MNAPDVLKALSRAPIINFKDACDAMVLPGPKLLFFVNGSHIFVVKTPNESQMERRVKFSQGFPIKWEFQKRASVQKYLKEATSGSEPAKRLTGHHVVAIMVEGGDHRKGTQLMADDVPEHALTDMVTVTQESEACQDRIIHILSNATHPIRCVTPVFQGIYLGEPPTEMFDPFNL